MTSESGIPADKYVKNILDCLAKDFPSNEHRKELYQMIKDKIGDELDKGHTHIGTQIGATRTAGRSTHNPEVVEKKEDIYDSL